MAVVKSTSFQGSPMVDVDPDVETWQRVLRNAQGDIAGTLDDLTSTAAATPIVHGGVGNGSLLGIPWVSQCLDRTLDFDTGGAKDGGATDTVFHPWFVVVEPGETSVVVEITIGNATLAANFANRFVPRLRFCQAADFDTAGGAVLETTMTVSGSLRLRLSATVTGITTPGLYLAIFMIESISTSDSVSELTCELVDCVIRKKRNKRRRGDVVRDETNPTPVQAPTGATSLFHQSMDETLFGVGDAMTGWHTSRLDRNINGLMEFMTGSPAGTNEDYTHTEDALINPTTPRFNAPNRKVHSSHPLPVIPIVSHCHGGIKRTGGYLVSPSTPASVAARRAFAPYPLVVTELDYGGLTVRVPDVPSGKLSWAILVGQSNAAGFANVRVAPRLTTTPTMVTPTALTGATYLALAQGTTLDFDPDEIASLFSRMSLVAGVHDPLGYCLLATCLWVQP